MIKRDSDKQVLVAEKGATMMEAMMVIPILFGTVFFIVWYSRSMHENNMINEAMYRAGKVASTIPNLDIDLQDPGEGIDLNAMGIRKELKEVRRAAQANRMIRDAAVGFLRSVAFIDSANHNDKEFLTLTKLVRRETPPATPNATNYSFTVEGEVMALLPGECVSYDSPTDGQTKNLCHNSVFGLGYSDDTPLTDAQRQTLKPMKSLLKNYPVRILSILRRDGSLFYGGGGEKIYSFYVIREPIPQGPFSQAIETEISNGEIDEGNVPEPVGYKVGPDEPGPGVGCDGMLLVGRSNDPRSRGQPYWFDPVTGSCVPKPK